jgi:hypothetical protein
VVSSVVALRLECCTERLVGASKLEPCDRVEAGGLAEEFEVTRVLLGEVVMRVVVVVVVKVVVAERGGGSESGVGFRTAAWGGPRGFGGSRVSFLVMMVVREVVDVIKSSVSEGEVIIGPDNGKGELELFDIAGDVRETEGDFGVGVATSFPLTFAFSRVFGGS